MSQGVVKDPEVLGMLKTSSNIKIEKCTFSKFFNNSTMGRTLDILFENKDTWIAIVDMLEIGPLSRTSVRVNTDLLLELGVIEKDIHKYYTFFKWNKKNTLAKHLEKLSNILSVNV